jgi:hypothetical protein
MFVFYENILIDNLLRRAKIRIGVGGNTMKLEKKDDYWPKRYLAFAGLLVSLGLTGCVSSGEFYYFSGFLDIRQFRKRDQLA